MTHSTWEFCQVRDVNENMQITWNKSDERSPRKFPLRPHGKNLNVSKTKPVVPRGRPLLLLLFFQNKSCMHNEVGTCTEILPSNFTLVNICIVHHIFHYLQLCWLQNTREIRKHFCLAFPTQVASIPKRCLFCHEKWTKLFAAAAPMGPLLEQDLICRFQVIQTTATPVVHG